jgi:hypothetical protein
MNSLGREIAPTKKPLVSGFLAKIGLFQTRHLLDRTLEVSIRAIGARAFRRHGVEPSDGLGQDAIKAALVVGALFPGGGVTDFRCAQQASAVASIAVFGDDRRRGVISHRRRGSCHSHFHPLAFLALNTDLTHRLKTLCDLIIDVAA